MPVYFLRNGEDGAIKIGFSQDFAIQQRVIRLQIGNPITLRLMKCIAGDRNREDEIQKRFKAHRTRGEWFSPVPELLEFIAKSKATRADGYYWSSPESGRRSIHLTHPR